LPPRRALLHSAVARAIERVHADRLDGHHAALGLHYRLGGVWDRALAHLRQAGAAAVACSANREAIACFEQALDVLTRLPAGAGRAEHEYDLTMYRAAVHYSLGEVRRIVDHLGHAEALARELGEPIRLARVAVLRLGTLAAMGRPAEAIAAGREGLAIADAARLVPLQASASVLLGFAHIGAGQFAEAVRFLRMTAMQLAGQAEHRRLGQIGLPAVFWRAWIALPLGETGEFREAIALAEEGVRIADAAVQPYSAALALAALGHVHGLQGEPRLAIPPLERSVALCRDHEMAVLSPLAFGSLGHAYAACGRVREALDLMEEAIARGDSLGVMWCQSLRTSRLGEGLLLAGRADDARAAAERALALADAHAEPANRAYALRLRAEIARQTGGQPGAEADLVEALRLAEELGMRPLAARCQLELGRL
jgi:tetratricopeptide (TPR) repeat protein